MRILVVEDNPSFKELFQIWLAKESFETLFVSDGLAATGILKEDRNFQLLITDFNMPGMDGFSLLNWCRTEKFHFPVIFTTASTALFPREQLALSDCCAQLLRKPFTKADFLEKIATAKSRLHSFSCPK